MAEESQKKALLIFHIITVIAVIWFFNLQGQTSTMLYVVCVFLGLGTGFWAIFVTMAAEQFGTNIRATVATTVPNIGEGFAEPGHQLLFGVPPAILPRLSSQQDGCTGLIVFAYCLCGANTDRRRHSGRTSTILKVRIDGL